MKIASLFAGCGGSDLGAIGGFEYIGQKYKDLSNKLVYVNDIDAKALNTHKKNFEPTQMVCGDIREIDYNTIPDHDLLLGGFPCQSFSTVNPSKDPFDERANLYRYMAQVLKIKQPSFFIAENVKGLVTLHKGAIFKRVCEEFEKCGYNLTYALINSADFGIPQRRERIFIVGIKKEYEKRYEFPKTTHSQCLDTTKKTWVPLNKVIDSLIPEDEKYYFSKKAVEGMKNAKNNMKRGLYQDLDAPCLTITSHLAKVSLNSRDPVLLVDAEKELYRRFTPREAARIQSFPDSFELVGSQADAYRQIGNAIPPVVMWHLVDALKKQFKEKDIRNMNDKAIVQTTLFDLEY
ncbi:MAG: DNA cytosine methyltransferase [Cellulosilyticaceae bacterium]